MPAGYRTTTSVVVPSYREDPDILERCLKSWLAENPTEVIVVPDVGDAEVIAMLVEFFRRLGLAAPRVRLEINTLGDAECRPRYREHLTAYLRERSGALCQE